MSNFGVISHSKSLNAIKLTENDVIRLRQNKINSLPCNYNTWSLKYGFEMLALSNICTNISINEHFRSKFFLNNTSILAALSSHAMTSLIPPVAAAAVSSAYFGHFLYKFHDECLTCRELKTTMLHITIGSILPTGISWIVSFLHADLFKTYGVPNTDSMLRSKITKSYYLKQTKDVWKKTTKNSIKVISINYCIQVVLCSFILFMQQRQFVELVLPLKFTKDEINKIKL